MSFTLTNKNDNAELATKNTNFEKEINLRLKFTPESCFSDMNSPVKSVQDCNNSIDRITNLRFKNPKNLIGYLNINSLRNKIVDLREICNSFSPDYFVIAETKLDQSFPSPQFMIDNYEIRNRKDRNKHGGGLIEYVKKGVVILMIQLILSACVVQMT